MVLLDRIQFNPDRNVKFGLKTGEFEVYYEAQAPQLFTTFPQGISASPLQPQPLQLQPSQPQPSQPQPSQPQPSQPQPLQLQSCQSLATPSPNAQVSVFKPDLNFDELVEYNPAAGACAASSTSSLHSVLEALLATYNIQANPLPAEGYQQDYDFMLNLAQRWISINKLEVDTEEKISALCRELNMAAVWPQVIATESTPFGNSLDVLINNILQNNNVILAFFANGAPLILLDMFMLTNAGASLPCIQLYGLYRTGAFSSCLSLDSLRNIMAELIRVGHQELNQISILIFRKGARSIALPLHKLSITDK